MNRGDFVVGFIAGFLVGVGISASKAADFTEPSDPRPPVVITLILPEQGMSAEFLCEQQTTYLPTKNKERPK